MPSSPLAPAASTGHIRVHEAGAIEFGGHKVFTLPHHNGKISAGQIKTLLDAYQNDANHDHMVCPAWFTSHTQLNTERSIPAQS